MIIRVLLIPVFAHGLPFVGEGIRVVLILVFRTDHLLCGRRRVKGYTVIIMNGCGKDYFRVCSVAAPESI